MAGRPTLYNKKLQEKADRYVAGGYIKHEQVIPSIAGLAIYLSVNRSSIYEWKEKHPIFSNTLDKIEDKQHVVTLNKGLKGEFNSAITKLILHNHGYTEAPPRDNADDIAEVLKRIAERLPD